MKHEGRENPFIGMSATRPSPELRRRVLHAAAHAAECADSGPTIWDRLWSSRPLRVAWGVTVASLLLAHFAIDMGPRTSTRNPRASAAALEQEQELAEILQLEKIEISPRAEAIAIGRRESKIGRIDS